MLDSKFKFYEVEDPIVLISILEERLPLSCMMYNQVVHFKKFKENLKFYTIGKEIDSKTWIVSNNIREDYPSNYSISAPVAITSGTEQIPPEVKECILNGGVLPWGNMDNAVIFSTVPPITDMIIGMSVYEKGHLTEIHPCHLYYMEKEEALKLEITHDDPNVEIRRLDVSKQEDDFILKTWKYSLPGTDMEMAKCISRNASGGVFVNGKCVSGVYIPAIGFISALYTLKEYRNKGYAKLTMKYAFKEHAKDGHIPCLTVEIQNPRSIKFHESLGLKNAGQVNSILIKKLDVD